MSAARTAIGHAAQLVSITVWSVGLIVQKSLTPAASPASILMMQFGAAAAIMWTALALAGRLPRPDRASVLSLCWGVFAPGAVLALSLAGAARTDGISLSLMWALVPLLVPVLARVILSEPLHWSFPVGALIGVAGLLVLVQDRLAQGFGDLAGNLLALGGVTLASFSQIAGRWLNAGRAPWYQTATLQVTGAALATTVLALALGPRLPDLGQSGQALSMLYLVLAMTVINFLAFNLALARIRAAWVSIYVALAPAIGTLAAVVLLGAVLRPGDALGIAVIMAGVALPHLMRLGGRVGG